MSQPNSNLSPGTLDRLLLKVVALGLILSLSEGGVK